MPPEFETATCVVCGSEIDESVEGVTREIPGATFTNRFCSERHRRDYLDKMDHVEEETPHERISHELRESGMDPEAFDSDTDEEDE